MYYTETVLTFVLFISQHFLFC